MAADNPEPRFSDLPREELSARVHWTLRQRLWLRFHTFLIIALTVFVGFTSSVLLQRTPILRQSLGLRYAISCALAYLAFLWVVRWWVKYIAGIRAAVGDHEEDQGRFDPSALKHRREKPSTVDGSPDPGCDPGCLDIEGLLVAVVVVGAYWLMGFGSVLLAEVAADALLAGGLIRWARHTESAWMASSVRATRLPFLLIAFTIVSFGFFAQAKCPASARFGEVWACLTR